MKVIQSVKPSGTYVKVRLLRMWRAKPDDSWRYPGEEIVCNDLLADHLATQFIGAVLTEAPERAPLITVQESIR